MADDPLSIEHFKDATGFLKSLLAIYQISTTADQRRTCVARMLGVHSWARLPAYLDANQIFRDEIETVEVVRERSRMQQAALRQVLKLDKETARDVRVALNLTGRLGRPKEFVPTPAWQRDEPDSHRNRDWPTPAVKMHPFRAKAAIDRLVELMAGESGITLDEITMHLTRNLPRAKGITPLDRQVVKYDNVADCMYVFEQAMNEEVVMIDGSRTEILYPAHKAEIFGLEKGQGLTLYVHFGPGRFPSPFPDRWIEGCYILLPTAKRGLYMVPVAESDYDSSPDNDVDACVSAFAQSSRMIMIEVGERHYASFDLDVIRPGSLGGHLVFSQWAPHLRSVVKAAWSYVHMTERGWGRVDTSRDSLEARDLKEALRQLRFGRAETLGYMLTRSHSIYHMMWAAKLYHADIGMPLVRLRAPGDKAPIIRNSFPLPLIDDPFAWASSYLEICEMGRGNGALLALASDILDRAMQIGMAVSEGVPELKALVQRRLQPDTGRGSWYEQLSHLELAERTGRKLDDREIAKEMDRALSRLDVDAARRLVEHAGLRDDGIRNLAVGAFGVADVSGFDEGRRLLFRTGAGLEHAPWLPTAKLKRFKEVVQLADRVRLLPSQEWHPRRLNGSVWIETPDTFNESTEYRVGSLDDGKGVRIAGVDSPQSRMGAIDLQRKLSVDAGASGIEVTYSCDISVKTPEDDDDLPVDNTWRHGALAFIKWDFDTIAAGFEASGAAASKATFVARVSVNDARIEALIFDIEDSLGASTIRKYVKATAIENTSPPEVVAILEDGSDT